jgi:hypothetical protein
VNDLANASTVGARDDRLGTNDGAENANGYIRAGEIRFEAETRLYVQNSGINSELPDDRRGLTAGSGGITIVTTGDAPLEIIINGRQENGAGGFITGAALIPEIDFEGVEGNAQIAAGSTVNGCLISGEACGIIPPPPPPPPEPPFIFVPPVQDVLEDLLDEEGQSRPPVLSLGQLIDVERGPLLGVIDDPVTSTGNDDIWSPANAPDLLCEEEDRGDCVIDQPVTGTGNEELQRGGDSSSVTNVAPAPGGDQVEGPATASGNENLQGDGESE